MLRSQYLSDSIVFRKLLTRVVWNWSTKRYYPVRKSVHDFSPIEVHNNTKTVLAVLTVPANYTDALWTAYSFYRFLPRTVGLILIVDGQIAPSISKRIERIFPGLSFASSQELVAALPANVPSLFEFGRCHPLGRKLAAILLLQSRFNLLYSDADVLCFNDIAEIRNAIEFDSRGLYIQEGTKNNIDDAVKKQIEELHLSYASTLNSGCLYIPKCSLSIDDAELLVRSTATMTRTWFTEMTILSVLMEKAGANPLPKSRYVVSNTGQFYFEKDVDYNEIAVRHFVTPVRHLMYSHGMPILKSKIST